MAKTFKQQARQFCRIAYRWRIIKFVARMVADACFCGVGKDKTHFRVMCQLQEFIVFTVDADFTINRANQTRVADRFPLLIQTTNDGGVQTILSAKWRREWSFNWTNNDNAWIQIGVLIQEINLPVDKGT